jgi:hypothetical protein
VSTPKHVRAEIIDPRRPCDTAQSSPNATMACEPTAVLVREDRVSVCGSAAGEQVPPQDSGRFAIERHRSGACVSLCRRASDVNDGLIAIEVEAIRSPDQPERFRDPAAGADEQSDEWPHQRSAAGRVVLDRCADESLAFGGTKRSRARLRGAGAA